VQLTLEQAAAVKEILAWAESDDRFLSLSGPAGSGKTTLLKEVKQRLGKHAVWSAMTGRAARRMREAAGLQAKTLHSALYHAPREVDNKKHRRIDLEFDDVRREGCDVLVVDECSMMGRDVFEDVVESPYRKALFVGDGFQIPPVSRDEKREEDWTIFREVSGPRLTEVMRSSGAVVEAANYVRVNQEIPKESAEHGGSVYECSSDFREAVRGWFDDRDDHVLVTWKNDARMRLNRQIRQALGYAEHLPEPGEPVVVRKNFPAENMMNGDLMYLDAWLGEGPELAGLKTCYVCLREDPSPRIESFDDVFEKDSRRTFLTFLDGRDNGPFDGFPPYVDLRTWRAACDEAGVGDPIPITYGYCLTAHLAQGSEYRRVTTLLFNDLANRNFRKTTTLPDGSAAPFSMRWCYTAISRAKDRSTLVLG